MIKCIEETELWKLIEQSGIQSLVEAWNLIGSMNNQDIAFRSSIDDSSYLHHIVNQCERLDTAKLRPLAICIVYRLGHRGVIVNARNKHGNTALHLSCIKPKSSFLAMHLVRIGVDPCIPNNKECYVIYEPRGHVCYIAKGHTCARSGIWDAVFKEDLEKVEILLKSWTRVNMYRNKTLLKLAEDSTNLKLIRLLEKYKDTNELVCAAHACDVEAVASILHRGKADKHQKDESSLVPKPLLVSLMELGNISRHVIKLLLKNFSNEDDVIEYREEIRNLETAFESSQFYIEIEKNTAEGFTSALSLIRDYNPNDTNKDMNIHLISKKYGTKGWTYLHLVIDTYMKVKTYDKELSNILIRCIYRLALAGIDVDVRDGAGKTVLIQVALHNANRRIPPDQDLITHLLRIGCDSTLAHRNGDTIYTDTYNDKGKLIYNKKYRKCDLPGLWPAVENNDLPLTERWLKSWVRVRAKKSDSRNVIDLSISKDKYSKERGNESPMTKLLMSYSEKNEFVCATLACDLEKMMSIVALGKGVEKTNAIDYYYDVSATRHMTSISDVVKRFISADYIQRPLLVVAMEICSPEVVDFLLRFGANPAHQYNEVVPNGPVAFTAYLNHITNEQACIVATHADVDLRDANGSTMLHSAIQKDRNDPAKIKLLKILLDRGADVSARDNDGKTPRDYCNHQDDGGVFEDHLDVSSDGSDTDNEDGDTVQRLSSSRANVHRISPIPDVKQEHKSSVSEHRVSRTASFISRRDTENILKVESTNIHMERSTSHINEHDADDNNNQISGHQLSQIIDDHILELVYTDQSYRIESLLVNGYDHILDIHGTKRNKNARQICEQKLFKDTLLVLDSIPMYERNIPILHNAACQGDIRTISKLSGEKRCAFGRDVHGRTILHNAVLNLQNSVVTFIIEQYPAMINMTDSLKRTPLHYCVCLEQRHLIWPTLQNGNADPNRIDANNLSVYDYIRDVEDPGKLMKMNKFNKPIYRPSIEIKLLQECKKDD